MNTKQFDQKSHDDMVEEVNMQFQYQNIQYIYLNVNPFQIVQAPYRHIATVPGKNIRKKLALAFNFWLEIGEEKLTIISQATEMLHNASLM